MYSPELCLVRFLLFPLGLSCVLLLLVAVCVNHIIGKKLACPKRGFSLSFHSHSGFSSFRFASNLSRPVTSTCWSRAVSTRRPLGGSQETRFLTEPSISSEAFHKIVCAPHVEDLIRVFLIHELVHSRVTGHVTHEF